MGTYRNDIKTICAIEGLKSETSRANVEEIYGILSDWVFHDIENAAGSTDGIVDRLYQNGEKRAKRKKSKYPVVKK